MQYFTLKEIFEEPRVLENLIKSYVDLKNEKVVFKEILGLEKALSQVERIVIVGSGTAYHAGMLGKNFIEELAGIPVITEMSSEWQYKDYSEKADIFIVVSQSGKTGDTLAALRKAKKNKILTLAITNERNSKMAKEADLAIFQNAGKEVGVAATKSFISQAVILLLIAVFLSQKKDILNLKSSRILRELEKLPELIKRILNQGDEIKNLAKTYKKYSNFILLGRKFNWSIAKEGALKLKEMAGLYAEGLALGELKHGPMVVVDKNLPLVFIMPKDLTYENSFLSVLEAKKIGGPVFIVTSEDAKEMSKVTDDVVFIPRTLEILYPLLSIIPLQLLAYWIGVLKGHNVDKPKNLTKAVTRE